MKKLFGLAIIAMIFTGCSEDDDVEYGNWVERSVFDGIPRSNAASFVVNNRGYMGTGYDGDDYLNDFWEYDIDGDYWVQKADFPGKERSSAVGFTVDSKGYVGIGFDGDIELEDFWEYDPNTNTWNQKANFEGGPRRGAVGFATNDLGYIGTGYDGENDKKDFWKYDPSTDEWSELVGFGGDKRRDATTFEIDNKIYLGTGITNGLYIDDFWEFDPSTENWKRLKDLNEEDDYTITRSNAVSFTIDGLGYIATGYANGSLGSLWAYDPILDDWEEATSFEAYPRQDAVSFSLNNKAYVLLGRSGTLYLDDSYEFFPNEEFDEDD